MSKVTFKGEPVELGGHFPQVGDTIADFILAGNDLNDYCLSDFKKPRIILNIFPSIDTPVCSESVVTFNTEVANLPHTIVLCISKDLPFAQARFCGIANIDKVRTLSAFRNYKFAEQLGLNIKNTILHGLLSRAVIVLDGNHKILYTELVSEISTGPDYNKCLAVIG